MITLSDYLQPLLPRGGPPPERRGADFTAWRHAIQRALTVAMALLHRSFAAKGVLAGCTSTVVLQVRGQSASVPASGVLVSAMITHHSGLCAVVTWLVPCMPADRP